MKNLFFVAVAIGIFSGTSITAKAQTSVNLESVASRAKPKISLKFIEGIEITPGNVSDNQAMGTVMEKKANSKQTINAADNNMSSIEDCSPLQFKYAMIMEREVESFTNTSLYSFIDEWWATRYRYGGEDKNGIDCSAFTEKVESAVYGISLPRTAKEQYSLVEKIPVGNLREGDLVFFNTKKGVSHVGVYLGNNYFVHSSVNAGVTISSLTDDYYDRKFIGGGRIYK
jgi:cell wall-associated NlpC family hydrolase